MFKESLFTAEQLAEFHRRSCDLRLGYEDCVMLGFALCAERDALGRYLETRDDPNCECPKCEAARARFAAIRGALDTIQAGIMATWPELCKEVEQRQADSRAFSDKVHAQTAELLSHLTGVAIRPEDITTIRVVDTDEMDPADLARFSPVAGHG
jgi:hypothetical protein